jgi:hypothetical protein
VNYDKRIHDWNWEQWGSRQIKHLQQIQLRSDVKVKLAHSAKDKDPRVLLELPLITFYVLGFCGGHFGIRVGAEHQNPKTH